MDPIGMALSSLETASSAQMLQYSMSVAKEVMNNEEQSASKLLEMLPPVRGPQPGDVPAIMKGNYVDVYA